MGRDEQGAISNRYAMIPRTLIFLTRGEQVLLLKGAATKRLWPNRYNGVGGHVERGENVIESARRELQEETGLVPERLWLAGVICIDAASPAGIVVFVFRGVAENGDAIASREGTLEWVRREDLDRLDLVEDLPQMLERVLASRPGDPPFFADYSYDSDDRLVIHYAENEPPV